MSYPGFRSALTVAYLAIVVAAGAQTGVPVMQAIADMETTVTVPRHDEPDFLHVNATNAPERYDATGLPPGVTFGFEPFNGALSGVFSWQHATLTGGTFTVAVTATNAAGTSAPASFRWLVHPGMIDFIYSDKAVYVAGEVITFTATFSAPVMVNGSPYLQLWGAKKAMYASGSGTSRLTFSYLVAADDPEVLSFSVSDIQPGNGSIATADGVSASLHDTYNGIGFQPGLRIADASSYPASSRLVNLSSRAQVLANDSNGAFIAGFVVGGYTSKRFLLRAVGPALGPLGVQNPLPNPKLELFDRDGKKMTENEDWGGSVTASDFAQVGAFGFDAGSRDAALMVTLDPGPYTFHVAGNGGSGVALVEVYDANGGSNGDGPSLVNISSRGFVGTGDSVLIAGFVVTGDAPKRFLIRGVGPGLAAFGVDGVILNPMIKVFQGSTTIAFNDNWEISQSVSTVPAATAEEVAAAAVTTGAFALKAGSKDAATIVVLWPGSYTAVMSGADGGTGSGLVEVYAMP